jgi:hypothetical protein
LILDPLPADPGECLGDILEDMQLILFADELEGRAPNHAFHRLAYYETQAQILSI